VKQLYITEDGISDHRPGRHSCSVHRRTIASCQSRIGSEVKWCVGSGRPGSSVWWVDSSPL